MLANPQVTAHRASSADLNQERIVEASRASHVPTERQRGCVAAYLPSIPGAASAADGVLPGHPPTGLRTQTWGGGVVAASPSTEQCPASRSAVRHITGQSQDSPPHCGPIL